ALLGGAVVAAAWLAGVAESERPTADGATSPDPTAPPPHRAELEPGAFGIEVTGGAAAGYVEDRLCATCHGELYESYQDVGMAQSFARPQNARAVEDFDAPPYFHAPSNRYYAMRRSGDGGLVMERWQLTGDGERIHIVEQPVDWVLGSGHTSRVYLYRTAGGELYQLPLAWYSQGQGWGMSPGYDAPVHEGLTRRIRRECMFCHNGYPDVPAGSDRYGAPQTFPAELPEGTGCQRCHGPGGEHIARVFSGRFKVEEIRDAVVNPAQLSPKRRTQDVIHVAMTDHKIQHFPAGRDLLAPLEERSPILVDLNFLRPDHAPPSPSGEIYRTAAVLRAGGGPEVAGRLRSLLGAAPPADVEPWLDLARADVQQRRWSEASATLAAVEERLGDGHPAWPTVWGWRAMVAAGEGRVEASIPLFERALEVGDDPGILYNFGVVLASADRLEAAERRLRRVVELRPHHLPALFYLARLAWVQERPAESKTFLRRALASDPGHGESYLLLGQVQLEAADRAAAFETWRLGVELSRDPRRLRAALAREGA
ncbi:MAG: hypothetical protein AAFY88_16230, partial [Acidobacteriota bacterium]